MIELIDNNLPLPSIDKLPEPINEDLKISSEIEDNTLREYVVTLKEFQDLDAFYNDMETIGGTLYIPNREVSVVHRRPSSRSTHYKLTQAEVKLLQNDPRVNAVELTINELGIKVVPLAQYSDNWSKSSTESASQRNWGLLRCYNGQTTSNWGSDGTGDISGTVNITNGGKNVDVVIIDGHIDPNNPEYAVNADGTGGSRVVQYNWYQHNPSVTGGVAGTYDYSFLSAAATDNNHGTHVAGTACGNTQGWARNANIYNISPYGNGNTAMQADAAWIYHLIDYVRAFHNNKSVNPITGRKNPTICNMSFGLSSSMLLSSAAYVQFQGNIYAQPAGGWEPYRAFLGLIAGDGAGTVFWYTRDSSLDSDIASAIADGIIFVGAAGNFYMHNAAPSSINYNNALITSALTYNYYMRGPSPGAATDVIHVSAVDSTIEERKADYSNAGTRTDIFAPGSTIMSASRSGTVSDSRNNSYKIMKMSGTSMATPQVTGVLACLLTTYPGMTATSILTYLNSRYVSNNQLTNVVSNPSFPFLYTNSLLDGPNKYLKYIKERNDEGIVTPKKDYNARSSSGRVYPRVRIKRRG